MKKVCITLFILTIILSQGIICANAYTFQVQELPQDTLPLLSYNDKAQRYEMQMEGTTFLITNGVSHYTQPIEYNYDLDNALAGMYGNSYEYIWTGKYYMVRNTSMDGIWLNGSQYISPLRIYDANYNLVTQYMFPQHIAAIGYYNGNYYCRLCKNTALSLPWQTVVSSDLQNWTPIDMEEVPKRIGTTVQVEDQVDLGRNILMSIKYENEPEKEYYSSLGQWVLKKDKENNFYLSNDNVYFVKIAYPDDLSVKDINYGYTYDLKCVYENGDSIIIDLLRGASAHGNSLLEESYEEVMARTNKTVRLTTPKRPIYDALDAQKSAPYVCVNNTILGFETPPVTESDRTLVPMRFLFEQLGAEVTWDEATETATAVKDDTTISFTIDNTTATVNGAATTMDVPARLVNDKTMVPLRFLSEEMGYTVEWDEETRMATVITE